MAASMPAAGSAKVTSRSTPPARMRPAPLAFARRYQGLLGPKAERTYRSSSTLTTQIVTNGRIVPSGLAEAICNSSACPIRLSSPLVHPVTSGAPIVPRLVHKDDTHDFTVPPAGGRYREDMTSDQVEPYHVNVNKSLLITGAVLAAVGGAVAFAGMALGMSAAFSAARDFIQHMEVPPREMAARRWRQAKTAAGAGAQAWRSASNAT